MPNATDAWEARAKCLRKPVKFVLLTIHFETQTTAAERGAFEDRAQKADTYRAWQKEELEWIES
jgi:hypothetical protein